ncbi:ABC transporter permease [Halovivax limisalsi]|uniref:ABC transporter permease subunit n=1 Tax=Halovivax limisalsi TaxID=1453760 RepID=UPI001FFD259D|nr:ABC transporter permease [Halovivax limisalsi]
MTRLRSILSSLVGRVLWAFGLVFVVVSAMFVLIYHTTPPEARGYRPPPPDILNPPPVHEQYVEFLGSFLRLDWGTSETAARWTSDPLIGSDGSNVGAVVEALPVTLAYVVPSAILAFALALGLGYVAANRPRSIGTRFSATSLYLLFSLPNFFLAALIAFTLRDLDPGWFPSEYAGGSPLDPSNLLWLTLPTFVLTTHLVAGFFRYARAETRETLEAQFVTLVKAKGRGPVRTARHVFRSVALPLVSLFVAEMIAILLVAVFVIEVVFEVPGIGLLTYEAIRNREIELAMVLTAGFSTATILANLAEDLLAETLDPRLGADGPG